MPALSKYSLCLSVAAIAVCMQCNYAIAAEADADPPPLRIRGSASDLAINQDADVFADTVPASLTWQRDHINDVETHAADIFLGYKVPLKLAGQIALIPYVGLVKSKVETKDVFDAAHSTEQRIIGLSADIFKRGNSTVGGLVNGYRLIGRIESNNDDVDRTRQQTASVLLRPYIWHLNRKPFPGGNSEFYIHPILNLRFDAINYSRHSTFAEVAKKQDNSRRAGAEAGIAIGTADNRLHYSFRYLKLNDWKGEGDVSHSSHAIEARLDKQGIASLVLRYDRGVPDDQFEREKVLSLLLAVRY